LCLAKLHKFLKLKLLESQFRTIIKILLNRCFVLQYSLFDVIISCSSSVYLWLHIQSLVDDDSVLVWRVLTLYQHTDNVLHKIYIQLHNCESVIIHTFHPRSSLHFTSVHFTPHFSLPRTFGRFVTTLQKASLLTKNYFPNPLSKNM